MDSLRGRMRIIYTFMFSISYDPTQDLQNWLRIKAKYPETFKLTQFYPFDKRIRLSKNNFEKIVKTIPAGKIQEFNRQAETLKIVWQKQEDEVIKKITNFLKTPFQKFNLAANLTTAYYMPYDYSHKWFMAPTHKNLNGQLICIIHELFHFYDIQKNGERGYEEKEKALEEFWQWFSSKNSKTQIG